MLPNSFSRTIALRYLWSGRKDAAISIITVIAILGVMVGVITLNVVMAVMSGFEVTLREKILGADAHIIVRQVGGEVREWREVQEVIAAVPEVVTAAPYTTHQALIRGKERASGVIVRGLAEGTASVEEVARNLTDAEALDRFFRPAQVEMSRPDGSVGRVKLPGLFVGRELAKQLRLFTGDTVSLLSPEVGSSPFGLMPRFKRFRIAGIYSSGLVEYENSLVYLPLEEAQGFFRTGGGVNGFEVRLEDIDAAPQVASAIVDALGPPFYAQPWTETNRAFFEALKLEQRVYFIVLLLIVVMASFSIVSSLVMIVVEKRKDIGILRTLGATASSVGAIFRFQGAVIGGTGVVLGTVLGFLGCIALDVYGFPIDERIFQMSTLPIHIEVQNFIGVALAAFLICYLATIYPARKASRLQPADVLRYE